MDEDSLKKSFEDSLKRIRSSSTPAELDKTYIDLFGKRGYISLATVQFAHLPKEQVKIIAPRIIQQKIELEREIENARNKVREESYQALENETFKFPHDKWESQKRQGHMHLATQFKQEIIELFGNLGFEQFDAPHIEHDKYNFEDLNIPKDHPSRDMWDTLYIDTGNLKVEPGSMLLRTHTSNFWPRLMEKGETPIRAMSFDRCFRYEAVDARHSHTFNQFEVAVVGKNITMANLKFLSDYLLKALLGKEAKSRFRPKYYPFVEPGVGIDCRCVFCHGKGCKICSNTGWFEIAGAGMIHPNVFKATGLDPKVYTGLAWGFGPDRMMMLKHNIEDIRVFLEGDLKFLEKY